MGSSIQIKFCWCLGEAINGTYSNWGLYLMIFNQSSLSIKFIRSCSIQPINVFVGACGSLAISTKFESSTDLKNFEAKSKSVFDDIWMPFNYMQTNFSDVYVYTYAARSVSTEITLN